MSIVTKFLQFTPNSPKFKISILNKLKPIKFKTILPILPPSLHFQPLSP